MACNADGQNLIEEEVEEEVFFRTQPSTKSVATSTPIPAPTKSSKRKRSPAGPSRRTRQRARMAGTASDSDDSSVAEEPSMATFMANMTKEMAKMNANLAVMQESVRATVAEAIAPVSTRIDANTRRMNKMEKKQRENMVELNLKMDRIAKTTSKSGTKDPHALTDGSVATYAFAASAPAQPATAGNDANNWYWDARRCLRLFPVDGADNTQIMQNLDVFLQQKLKIPPGMLQEKDIKFVRRIKSTKRTKIAQEILVSFVSVETRDMVHSHAKNLAEWVDKDNKPLAGVRLEIPERLIGDFKALEQYGHAMKGKHKAGFKRHIKLDDAILGLYLDCFIPKLREWIRIDMDVARKDNKNRLKKRTGAAAKNLIYTADSDSEDDKMQ